MMPTTPFRQTRMKMSPLKESNSANQMMDDVVLGQNLGGGPGASGNMDGGLKVVVLEHPSDTFYKDEGGKANHLAAVITLESMGKANNLGCKVTIHPRLCYENLREVEDGEDIFKVLSVEPKVVTSLNEKVLVKYRIEKVSRRKDGQRFSVRFDVESNPRKPFKTAYTNPVTVLSKRKFPNNQTAVSIPQRRLSTSSSKRTKNIVNTSIAAGTRRGSSLPTPKSESVVTTALQNGATSLTGTSLPSTALNLIESLQKTVSMLQEKVNTLEDRISLMEDQQQQQLSHSGHHHDRGVPAGKTKRAQIGEYEDLYADPINSNDMINLCKYKLDYADAEGLFDIDEFDPPRFNFGLPSSSAHSI